MLGLRRYLTRSDNEWVVAHDASLSVRKRTRETRAHESREARGLVELRLPLGSSPGTASANERESRRASSRVGGWEATQACHVAIASVPGTDPVGARCEISRGATGWCAAGVRGGKTDYARTGGARCPSTSPCDESRTKESGAALRGMGQALKYERTGLVRPRGCSSSCAQCHVCSASVSNMLPEHRANTNNKAREPRRLYSLLLTLIRHTH